jgi:hypothetical protein
MVNSNRLGMVAGCLGIAMLCLLPGINRAAELAPFVSDGCSYFPDGTPDQPELWRSCCVEHDRVYWGGGTSQQRIKADMELRQCVAAAGAPKVAVVMEIVVRWGGSPYLPFPFRWGFGWPYPRDYRPLRADEREKLAKLKVGRGW